MKLYTEEQMKEAIKIALHGFGIGGIEDTIEVVASKFTPIELPTDDELKKQFDIDEFDPYDLAYLGGAIRMRNLILGGNSSK